jgi:hypothetical protein
VMFLEAVALLGLTVHRKPSQRIWLMYCKSCLPLPAWISLHPCGCLLLSLSMCSILVCHSYFHLLLSLCLSQFFLLLFYFLLHFTILIAVFFKLGLSLLCYFSLSSHTAFFCFVLFPFLFWILNFCAVLCSVCMRYCKYKLLTVLTEFISDLFLLVFWYKFSCISIIPLTFFYFPWYFPFTVPSFHLCCIPCVVQAIHWVYILPSYWI